MRFWLIDLSNWLGRWRCDLCGLRMPKWRSHYPNEVPMCSECSYRLVQSFDD